MVVTRPDRADERDLLAAQLGLITRAQAIERGHTQGSIKSKISRGEWAIARRGIYRATVFPVTKEQALLAECLRSPGHTWASHRSAAWLHELMPPPSRMSISTTGRLRDDERTDVHHASYLPPCDEAIVRGVPATAIERTLIDIAAQVSLPQLDHMIDEAITTRRTSVSKIEWRLRRIGGRGRAGSAAIRRCLGSRRRTGQVDSLLEREFLNLLTEAGLPRPALQYPIELATKRFVADFAFPEQRLIVEVMGYRWHGGRESWERDLLRSSELGAAGWRMLYVTRQQIRRERIATIDRLGRALGLRPLFVL